MRGPISRPASISLRHPCTMSSSLPMSRTPVTPFATNSGSEMSCAPENQMHVHIPEPGNQEKAAAVHARSVPRVLRRFAGPHQSNVIALENYGLLGLQCARSNIDDRHIVEHE